MSLIAHKLHRKLDVISQNVVRFS